MAMTPRRFAASLPPQPDSPSAVDDIEFTDRKASARARNAAERRRSSGRRRLIDPTTCERDYTEAEMEFLKAIEEYKRRSGRMFPTWSEVLEVIRELGYTKS